VLRRTNHCDEALDELKSALTQLDMERKSGTRDDVEKTAYSVYLELGETFMAIGDTASLEAAFKYYADAHRMLVELWRVNMLDVNMLYIELRMADVLTALGRRDDADFGYRSVLSRAGEVRVHNVGARKRTVECRQERRLLEQSGSTNQGERTVQRLGSGSRRRVHVSLAHIADTHTCAQ
jgi:hypothetical protein